MTGPYRCNSKFLIWTTTCQSLQKKRVKYWLTSSVFMDICKRWFALRNSHLSCSAVSDQMTENHKPIQALFQCDRKKKKKTTLTQISQHQFQWVNQLVKRIYLKRRDIKPPNKSICWARDMNCWTRTTTTTSIAAHDDEMHTEQMHKCCKRSF